MNMYICFFVWLFLLLLVRVVSTIENAHICQFYLEYMVRDAITYKIIKIRLKDDLEEND